MICQSCGAELVPSTEKCTYCSTEHNCIFLNDEELYKIMRSINYIDYNPFSGHQAVASYLGKYVVRV